MATIIDGKTRIPFMRGMLVHHLIQRGMAHGEARDIANAVRDLLGKQSEVSRKEMVRTKSNKSSTSALLNRRWAI